MKKILTILACLFWLGITAQAINVPTPESGQIERLTLHSDGLNADLTIDVWLPEGYNPDSETPYPVIFMHDGQALFDAALMPNNLEWDVDGNIATLISNRRMMPTVVVGIHNLPSRCTDFAPEKITIGHPELEAILKKSFGVDELHGDEYLDFIVNTVRPIVIEKYNLTDKPEQTCIMGSSMGGIISLYGICEYPEIFGLAGALSCHWIGTLDLTAIPTYPEAMLEYLATHLPDPATHKIYIDRGTIDLDWYYEEWHAKAVELFKQKGWTDASFMGYIDEGAWHNEECWKNRLHIPLEFLMPTAPKYLYNLPEDIQDGVILHCFCWKLQDIIEELPNIAAAGFGAIQTSPMQRNVPEGDRWYDVYRPYDYRFIANGMGTADDMRQLCEKAAEYGIKIIVDIVANHGTGTDEEHDPWWDENGRMRWNTGGIDWSNRYSETHDELGGYGDSNSADPEVQQRTLQYVQELKSLGVKGLRWDAAKHIELPSEGTEFWNVVMSEPGIYSYGEILGTPAGPDSYDLMREYASLMHVTDSSFNMFLEQNWLHWLGIGRDRCVFWAESHDTYSHAGGGTYHMDESEIDKRWALVAAREGATALYLSRPTSREFTEMNVGYKGSTHFTAPQVAGINHFHNEMIGQPELFYNDGDLFAVYRHRGVAIVVPGKQEVSIPLGNLDPTLVYKDKISGRTFTIEGDRLVGTVGSSGIAAVCSTEGATPPSPSDPVFVYLHVDESVQDVDTYYCYVYDQSGESIPWPGAKMTLDPSLSINDITGGWYKYQIPADKSVSGYVLVSSSKEGFRYPGNGVPGIPLEGKSLAFIYDGSSWSTTQAAITEPTESVTDISMSNMLTAGRGVINNHGTLSAEIYTLNGCKICTLPAMQTTPLLPGIYVGLTADGHATKLMVR